jgi:hypothetical protein
MVTSPQVLDFLRGIDCRKMKDATFMIEVLDTIKEVGPLNVVYVIIETTLICRIASLIVHIPYTDFLFSLLVLITLASSCSIVMDLLREIDCNGKMKVSTFMFEV